MLIASTGDPLVIPSLNRDGDILSDLVLPLFGSIAGAESLLVAFDDDEPEKLTVVMAEAAQDRAVAAGKERRQSDGDDPGRRGAAQLRRGRRRRARAVREAALEAVAQGVRTADLGGHSGTTEFTDEVIERTKAKLEVWATL